MKRRRRAYRLGKRAKSVEQTRRAILAAAAACFRANGIRATSIERVARKADVAAGTVHHHFPDKDSLVEATLAHIVESLQLPQPGDLAGIDDLRERVVVLIKKLYKFHESSAAWADMYLAESQSQPALQRWAQTTQGSFDTLVTTALGPRAKNRTLARGLSAIVAPGFRSTLIRTGSSEQQAVAIATKVAESWLERFGPAK